MPTSFRYVPTSGDLSGKSFEEQTEIAFNELGAEIDRISDEATGATETANNALSIANQAIAEAQTATTMAQEAKQIAEQASGDVQGAYDEAHLATQTAQQALNQSALAQTDAANAVTTANEAKTVADQANSTANAVQGTASEALTIGRAALEVANQAIGSYIVHSEAIDANNYTSPDKVLAVNPASSNLPVSTPAYLDVVAESYGTSVTQTAWNANLADIAAGLKVYKRLGNITNTQADGTQTATFTATPTGGTATTGALTVTSTSNVLSVGFAPGSFTASATIGTNALGSLSFTVDNIENGTLSVGDTVIANIVDGIGAYTTAGLVLNDFSLSFEEINVSASAITLQIVVTWTNVTNSETTWSSWAETGGGGGGTVIGKIELLPFRADELPNGWYFANGDQYALTSPQGIALNNLSANFKADWGITVSGGNISIPNMFHTDGRGYFLRAGNSPGVAELDAFGSHLHLLAYNASVGAAGLSATNQIGATYNPGNSDNTKLQGTSGAANAGRSSAVGGTETRPLNIGMTPAIYLGV